MRLAIVGGGPAGVFTAEELLRGPRPVRVDIFERWPAIGGLVRYGVAPDHPHTKRLLVLMEKTCADRRVTLHLGIEVRDRPSPTDLLKDYDALVLATGASKDRQLGVPGESLCNVVPSQRFAGWLNGRPDCPTMPFAGNIESVAIVGNGNVALDVARVLCRAAGELLNGEVASPLRRRLAGLRVRRIYVIGRKGPAQTAFGDKELLELFSIPRVRVRIEPRDLELTATDKTELASPQGERARAVYHLFRRINDSSTSAGSGTEVFFKFFSQPHSFAGEQSVQRVHLRRCRLEGPPFAQRGVPLDEYEAIDADLVVTAIGHESTPLPGLPFDPERGHIPHRCGRVMPRVYAAGWISRPARGLIGHNRRDAIAVASAIFEDYGVEQKP